jgi:hypothetical protein
MREGKGCRVGLLHLQQAATDGTHSWADRETEYLVDCTTHGMMGEGQFEELTAQCPDASRE